jgi:transcriptional regulator with XRE-family HTH domain
MINEETLGERIKKVRKELGLSLDTLAAKSDITKSHLRMLEVSATQPSIRNLRKIAEALGVSTGYLVDGLDVAIVKPDEEITIYCKEFEVYLKIVFSEEPKYTEGYRYMRVPRNDGSRGYVNFNFFNEKDVN